jgi:hypothetical protein
VKKALQLNVYCKDIIPKGQAEKSRKFTTLVMFAFDLVKLPWQEFLLKSFKV